MWNELGISGGTAIVILIALYFVIKWAVKNGVKEAYKDITGKKSVEDIKNEKVFSTAWCIGNIYDYCSNIMADTGQYILPF